MIPVGKLNHITNEIIRKVSILLLMDDTRRDFLQVRYRTGLCVSILLLMDDTRRALRWRHPPHAFTVSILLLMDDTRRASQMRLIEQLTEVSQSFF